MGKSIKNLFKVNSRPTPKGNAGYDNPRENIDPHIKTQALLGKEILSEDSILVGLGIRDIPTDSKPILRAYSRDISEVNDYIQIIHDESNGLVQVGSGGLQFSATWDITFNNPTGKYVFLANDLRKVQMFADSANAQFVFSVIDAIGNQFVLTNDDNKDKDHDHATQTNPTLYIQSDTSPDSDNTEWLSFTHNQTEAVIESGKGGIAFTSDVFFESAGAGLPFGSCYGNEIAWAQASAVQNTWYDVSDSDMADGKLNLVTHDGNGQLTVLKAGMYAADIVGSFEANGANVHVQIAFSIDGTETLEGINHFETLGANNQHVVSNIAILDLTANQTVNVSIRTTDAGTPNLAIDHLSIRLIQVGGT